MNDASALWPGELVQPQDGPPVYVRHAPSAHLDAQLAVFVHGLGGSSLNWAGLMHQLRGELDQRALDLPGFGESPPASRHTVGAHAVAVTRYLETLGGSAHLVGNSMGGLVSLLVARRRPDLVRSLVLVSPAMPGLAVPRVARAMAVLAVPGLGERLLVRMNRGPVEEQVRRLVDVLYGDPGVLAPEELAVAVAERRRRLEQGYADAVFLESLRSIVRWYAAPPWRSVWAVARLVSCPVLVLVGGRDTLVGSSTARRWQHAVRRVQVAHLPTAGHVAMLERPAVVAALIRDHLANVSGRTSR